METRERWYTVAFLLIVVLGSAALAVALWDRDYPSWLSRWWAGMYVYKYFRARLLYYLMLIVPLGIVLWGASVLVRIAQGDPPFRAAWQQTIPYAVLFLTPWNALRYVWHPLGTNPGSAVWTYTLVLPIAFLLASQLTPLIPPGSVLRRRHPASLWTIIGVFLLTFGGLAFARHLSFNSHALDLGTMAQTAWNTAHGRFWEYTPLFEEYHPAPPLSNRLVTGKLEVIFLFIAPLYRIWASPLLLLALQTLALGLSAWPLFHTLYIILRSRRAALLLTGAYLAYLPLHYVAMADFHPSALMPFFLAWALYGLHTKQDKLYILALVGSLMCRVDAAFVLMGWTVLLVWQKRWRLALVTGVLGVGWFLFDFLVVVPWAEAHYGPDPVHLLSQRFGRYGRTPLEMMVGLLTHPLDLVRLLLEREKVQTAFDLLAPLGWVPLFGPAWFLPALPVVFLNLLADSAWQGTVRAHYFAPVLPFLFVATAYGIRRLYGIISYHRPPDRRLWSVGLALYVLMSAVTVAFYFSPFPLGREFRLNRFWNWSPHHAAIRRVLQQVDQNVPLSAQSNLLPHVAHRRYLYLYPSGDTVADEILLDLDFSAEHAPLDFYAFYESVDALIAKPEFGLKMWDNGVLLLARGYPHDEAKIHALRVAYDEAFYRVRWLHYEVPPVMEAGEVYRVRVCLQNVGSQGWRSIDWHPTMLSYHWLDAAGHMIVLDGERTPFLTTVYPQQKRCVHAYVYTPAQMGNYTLQFDLVREHIAWFSQKGAPTLDIPIRVVEAGSR